MSTGPVDSVNSQPSFAAGVVAPSARQIVPSRIAETRPEQPATVIAPNLGPYRIGPGPGYQLVVYSGPMLHTGLEPAIADHGQVFDAHV